MTRGDGEMMQLFYFPMRAAVKRLSANLFPALIIMQLKLFQLSMQGTENDIKKTL